MVKSSNYFLVIGGAGFIGSNIVERLLNLNKKIIVFDNLRSGKIEFLSNFLQNSNFIFINDDILNWEKHKKIMDNVDTLIHLASNADISKAISDPTIDFYHGTLLTQTAAEIARNLKISKFIYASGSGVYGDYGNNLLDEFSQELRPISPYGASKLAGEAILRSYSYMFDINVICFRFGNVVGKNQTHGVGYDFLNKLKSNKKILNVLGDGSQSKSYIHVDDLINALLLINNLDLQKFEVFNLSTQDLLSVSDIVELSLEVANVDKKQIQINYQNIDRGWKGDIPVVKLNSSKIVSHGWEAQLNSKEAMLKALTELWERI